MLDSNCNRFDDGCAPRHAHADVSAAVSLRIADYYTQGSRSFSRLHEKGGRYNVVPAHHTAQAYVDAYLEAAGIVEDRRGPLFRSCQPGRRDALQDRAMSRLSALKMIKRRARKAGLPAEICAHGFRGTGITEYLRNGGDLEIAGTCPPAPRNSIIACPKRSRSTRSSASTSESFPVTSHDEQFRAGTNAGHGVRTLRPARDEQHPPRRLRRVSCRNAAGSRLDASLDERV